MILSDHFETAPGLFQGSTILKVCENGVIYFTRRTGAVLSPSTCTAAMTSSLPIMSPRSCSRVQLSILSAFSLSASGYTSSTPEVLFRKKCSPVSVMHRLIVRSSSFAAAESVAMPIKSRIMSVVIACRTARPPLAFPANSDRFP